MEERSEWAGELKSFNFPKLKGEIRTEILIIGGGLAGVLTAYELLREGKKAIIIEKEKIGSGVTSYTTALVTQVVDTPLPELVKMFGRRKAKLIWDSGMKAIEEIERIVKEEKIDCDFKRCSAYIYANSEEEKDELFQRFTEAANLGYKVRFQPRNDLNFENFGYIEVKDQAEFDPIKFIDGLTKILKERGVEIYEGTEATRVSGENKFVVEAKEGKITCEKLLIATYYPFTNPKNTLFKKGMYVSYILEAFTPKGFLEEGIFWDLENPYHYFRVDRQSENDRLILGGEDHRKEIKVDKEKSYTALENYMKRIFPGMNFKLVRRWDGPILEPSDGVALIGEVEPNKYIASAFSGNGMTYSVIAAILLKDLVLGKENKWSSVYDPKRIPSFYQLYKKGRDYIGEFLGGAAKNALKKKKQK